MKRQDSSRDFGDRGRGFGDYQLRLKTLTDMKIVNKLATKPYTYEQLRRETRIQRNKLRKEIDFLVSIWVIIRHKYSFPEPGNYLSDTKNENDFPIPNRDYYILNLSNPLTRNILTIHKPIIPNLQNHFLKPEATYQAEQERQKKVRKYNENKKAYDTIEFPHLPSLYYTKEQEQNIIKVMAEREKELYDILERDKKAKQLIDEINKEEKIQTNYNEIISLFKENEKIETSLQPKIKQLATTLIELTYYYVNDGYSPLDVLINRTCGLPCNRKTYKLAWEILDKSGFLEKYVFHTNNNKK